jgi:hypothetical protein
MAMNANTSIMYELAKTRQRELRMQAENDRRARQARHETRASEPEGTRRSRRSWKLALRPQAQS